MTFNEICNDHTRRVEEVILWHAMGLISDKQQERYLACETETTEALFDQEVKEARYFDDCPHFNCPGVGDCEEVQLQDFMK